MKRLLIVVETGNIETDDPLAVVGFNMRSDLA